MSNEHDSESQSPDGISPVTLANKTMRELRFYWVAYRFYRKKMRDSRVDEAYDFASWALLKRKEQPKAQLNQHLFPAYHREIYGVRGTSTYALRRMAPLREALFKDGSPLGTGIYVEERIAAPMDELPNIKNLTLTQTLFIFSKIAGYGTEETLRVLGILKQSRNDFFQALRDALKEEVDSVGYLKELKNWQNREHLFKQKTRRFRTGRGRVDRFNERQAQHLKLDRFQKEFTRSGEAPSIDSLNLAFLDAPADEDRTESEEPPSPI